MSYPRHTQEPYSKVVRRMWGDDRFKVLTSKPCGQLLWLYLLTGPDCTVIPGLLPKMGLGTLADRLGWPYKAVQQAWLEIAAANMAEADWAAGVIWLPNGITHNPPANPNVVKAWGKVPLPECDLVVRALQTLRARLACRDGGLLEAFEVAFTKRFPSVVAIHTGNGSANGLGNGSVNGSLNGIGNQEQEQDQESTPQPPTGVGGVSLRKPSTRETQRAEDYLRVVGGRCPHVDEPCDNRAQCIGKLVMFWRAETHKGMQQELQAATEEARH